MPRFFLGQNNDPPRSICEPLKHLSLQSLAYASLTPGESWPTWPASHACVGNTIVTNGRPPKPHKYPADLEVVVPRRGTSARGGDCGRQLSHQDRPTPAGGGREALPPSTRPARRRIRPSQRSPACGGGGLRGVDPRRFALSRRRHR